MRILFIGDIVGKPGRKAVRRWLPELRESRGIDVVVANAENAAGGLGATPEVIRELRGMGIDAFTMGNHTWRKMAIAPFMADAADLVRPANYPEGVPGRGAALIALKDGRKLGLLNLIGRVYMEPFECPFRRADIELGKLRNVTPVVLVDMHAEATSEKIAMCWYLDGRCSAVVGTHTHVQTADERILPGGTACITDAGMCGPVDSVIGVIKERVIEKFRTGMPHSFDVAKGPAQFNAVVIEADDGTGAARRIERIFLREDAR